MKKNAHLVILGIAILVIGYLCVYDLLFSHISDDMGLYFRYAQNVMKGFIPFKDFNIEYPPFSLYYMVLPYLLGGRTIETYHLTWNILNAFLLFIPCMIFCIYEKSWRKGLIFIGLLALFPAEITFQRLDVIMAVLVFLSLYASTKHKNYLSIVLLAFATSLKFVPILLLPALLMQTSKKKALLQILLFMIIILACLLPFLFQGATFANLLYFWDYNKNREIQLESLWSTIGMIFHQPVNVYTAYGAKNLSFHYSNVYAQIAMYVTLLYILVCYSIAWFKKQNIFLLGCVCLMGLILLNKVLSPQYLLWIIPLIPFAIRDFPSIHRAIFISLLATIILITHFIVPIFYMQLISLESFAVVLLTVRNILLFVAVVYLIIFFIRYEQKNVLHSPHI
jgi:uncharacterized membrane protein